MAARPALGFDHELAHYRSLAVNASRGHGTRVLRWRQGYGSDDDGIRSGR